MTQLEPSLQIRTKVVHILITNACNLSCGGCNQLVGHIPKKKIFHVPVDEIRGHIKRAISIAREDWCQPWFPRKHRHLSLYGGEPTAHPDWPEILQMLYEEFADWPFVILTNGRTFKNKELPQSGHERFGYIKKREDIIAHDKNIFWRIELKDDPQSIFVPTLIAPIDVLGNPDKSMYFESAKKNCPFYEKCETLIYNNKGYFCINAGPMDWLFHDGANGWDLNEQEHPFKRTNEEIEAQAELFCHRCYFSINRDPVNDVVKEIKNIPTQPISLKSFVSKTNVDYIKPGSGQLITFDETPLDIESLRKGLEDAILTDQLDHANEQEWTEKEIEKLTFSNQSALNADMNWLREELEKTLQNFNSEAGITSRIKDKSPK